MTWSASMKAEQTRMARSWPHAPCRGVAFLPGIVAALSLLLVFTVATGSAQTIVDEWAAVKAPPPPELKAVTIDPKTTALLILDIQKQNCNVQRKPRCVASVPSIQKLLSQARAQKVPVIYSLGRAGAIADILPEVAPLGGEPLVRSLSDKFYGTELEKILKDKGIKTVIIVGTAAHGAVLYTSSSAVFRGFQVIVPVDGMSENTYVEQYTAWHLANVPGFVGSIILTKTDLIQF
jgi:nicotinamidase-related amidase